MRTKALTHKQGSELLVEAQAILPALSTVQHAQAFEMATQFGISAYNGRYISTAKQMRSKLVTEDAKLCAVVPGWTVSLVDLI